MEITKMLNLSTFNSKTLALFYLRILTFCIVLAINLLILYTIGREIELGRNIYSSVVLKHDLLEKYRAPRILLCGASGTLFGYDSALLSKLTGYPVINVSLTLQTGMAYILSEIEYYAEYGDIIILSPEYHFFMRDQTDVTLLAELCHYDPRLFSILGFQRNMIEPILLEASHFINVGTGSLLKNNILTSPYTLADITINGDIDSQCHTEQNSFADSWAADLTFQEGYPERTIREISETALYCSSIGAQLYIFFPAITDSFYCKSEIAGLALTMEDEINAQFLSGRQTSVYRDTMFFNSIYHLTSSAANYRTYQLYNLLIAKEHIF